MQKNDMTRNIAPAGHQPSLRTEGSYEESENPRIISKAEGERIIERVLSFTSGGGKTSVYVIGSWTGELKWARNRIALSSDRRNVMVVIRRRVTAMLSGMSTNQLDDVSLQSMVKAAERQSNGRPRSWGIDDVPIEAPVFELPNPKIWSDATYNNTAQQRTEIADVLMEEAEAKGMLSAGYLEMRAGSIHQYNPSGEGWVEDTVHYGIHTQAQCSMTVRHPKGVGSGWAGLSSFDWSAIDGPALAKRALDKCISSLNPVAIEPGRYTVILEPQAVADLVTEFMFWSYRVHARMYPEVSGNGPWVLGPDPAVGLLRSKLGLKVVDERITIRHDPMDPMLGTLPIPGLAPITWIERGILKTLSHDYAYAKEMLREDVKNLARDSFWMDGGPTSMDEMIETTKRGLIVTRFYDFRPIDQLSVLCTGVTRDGLWLVENGKITKAVKNMRVTESPMFVFNQVEQLGTPVPVFRPSNIGLTPAVVPPIKARDFSFTSMVDAV
jgi:predicted Zn-dependent protease